MSISIHGSTTSLIPAEHPGVSPLEALKKYPQDVLDIVCRYTCPINSTSKIITSIFQIVSKNQLSFRLNYINDLLHDIKIINKFTQLINCTIPESILQLVHVVWTLRIPASTSIYISGINFQWKEDQEYTASLSRHPDFLEIPRPKIALKNVSMDWDSVRNESPILLLDSDLDTLTAILSSEQTELNFAKICMMYNHGKMDTTSAEQLLKDKPVGSWLARTNLDKDQIRAWSERNSSQNPYVGPDYKVYASIKRGVSYPSDAQEEIVHYTLNDKESLSQLFSDGFCPFIGGIKPDLPPYARSLLLPSGSFSLLPLPVSSLPPSSISLSLSLSSQILPDDATSEFREHLEKIHKNYFHPDKDIVQTRIILYKSPPGSWLIRQSSVSDDLIISYKSKYDRVEHLPLSDGNIFLTLYKEGVNLLSSGITPSHSSSSSSSSSSPASSSSSSVSSKKSRGYDPILEFEKWLNTTYPHYYHPNLDRIDAEKLLLQLPIKTWLVRPCSRKEHLAISFKNKYENIVHLAPLESNSKKLYEMALDIEFSGVAPIQPEKSTLGTSLLLPPMTTLSI